jgi:hypothetical protein
MDSFHDNMLIENERRIDGEAMSFGPTLIICTLITQLEWFMLIIPMLILSRTTLCGIPKLRKDEKNEVPTQDTVAL